MSIYSRGIILYCGAALRRANPKKETKGLAGGLALLNRVAMLRARDFALPPSDLETQRKRTKRQRFLELALPCAFFAALLIAAFFSTGHQEASRRFMATRADAQLSVASESMAGRVVIPGADVDATLGIARTAGLVGQQTSFHPTARRTDTVGELEDASLSSLAGSATRSVLAADGKGRI